jgi:riboflavin synthase
MFTGLIEAICTVKSVRQSASGLQLTIDLGGLANETGIGDSIAIDGACLTVTKIAGKLATFDVSPETLEKSNLGRLKPSLLVNAERAMQTGDRFGGHFVQGHVDGIVTIKSIERKGDSGNIRFSAPPELLNQMVLKGSVAINGISLTIAALDNTGFAVVIIPQTWEKTTLSKTKIGDIVNIEIDIIVKTIKKQLENLLSQDKTLTIDKLKQMGF